MMLVLGWSGALLALVGALLTVLTRPVSRLAYLAPVVTYAPLASYALYRNDYPVAVLTVGLILVGMLAFWRGFLYRQRCSRIEPTHVSGRFARRRGKSSAVIGARFTSRP